MYFLIEMSTKTSNPLVLLLAITITATNEAAAITPVPLGASANYVILAQTGITTIGNTAITGNIALSSLTAAAITGFNLVLSSDGTYSTSSLVQGSVFAADYNSPTPSKLSNAVRDFNTAYNNAAGRTNPDFLDVGAGTLIGARLTPGLHKWTTPVVLGGTITLSGSSSDVFILQVFGPLTFSPSCQIVLQGGVLASNIFYQAGGEVVLGPSSHVQGTILGRTGIAFDSQATLNPGRALAGIAVTLIANNIRPL